MGMFFIKKSQAWVNPMQIASIFREGEGWKLSLSTGNTYPIEEEEYVELLDMMRHSRKGGEHEKKD